MSEAEYAAELAALRAAQQAADEAEVLKMAQEYDGWIACGPTSRARPEAVKALADRGLVELQDVSPRAHLFEFYPQKFRRIGLTS